MMKCQKILKLLKKESNFKRNDKVVNKPKIKSKQINKTTKKHKQLKIKGRKTHRNKKHRHDMDPTDILKTMKEKGYKNLRMTRNIYKNFQK